MINTRKYIYSLINCNEYSIDCITLYDFDVVLCGAGNTPLNQDKFDTFQWNFVRQKWRVMWNYVIFGNSVIVINNSKKKKTKIFVNNKGLEIWTRMGDKINFGASNKLFPAR